MANPTWQDVINIAPGDPAFADATKMPAAAQTAILGYAIAQCNSDAWGPLWFNGVVYLAAHMAKLGLLAGRGLVTSESVGSLSRSYATPVGLRGSLGLTAYGAEYKRLMKLTPAALGAVY